MRYVMITVLLVLATMLFGKLVSGFSTSSVESNRKPTNTVTGSDYLSEELGSAIFFTENQTPVRLVATADNSKSLIPVNFESVFNALGQKVDLTDKLVVSVFDKQPAKSPVRLPTLTISKTVISVGDEIAGLVDTTTNEKLNKALPANLSLERNNSLAVVSPKDAPLILGKQPRDPLPTNDRPQDDALSMPQKVSDQAGSDQVASKKAGSRYRKIAMYAVPATIGVAALTRSRRSKNNDQPASNESSTAKVAFSSKVISSQSNASSDTDSSDTDTATADQIDDIEDDLEDLSDTVDGLGTQVSGVQTNVSTLQEQVGTVKTQLGDNDVDALASQLKSLEGKTYAGIASAASLVTAIPSEPGKTILNVGTGHYEGETAIGVSLSRRLTNVNGYFYGGVASGISEVKSPLIRVGVGIEF
jgi:hypothetical protein